MGGLSDFQRSLSGYQLVTAEILYRMPDHPRLLQTFVWQEYDMEPRYPVLTKFLKFWDDNLDGPLHSIRLATKRIIDPSEFVYAGYLAELH